MTTLLSQHPTVTISGKEHPHGRRWRGERLLPADGYLAFDTETEVIDLHRHIPRLALASASAGPEDSCLIHPDDLGQFVQAHRSLLLLRVANGPQPPEPHQGSSPRSRASRQRSRQGPSSPEFLWP